MLCQSCSCTFFDWAGWVTHRHLWQSPALRTEWPFFRRLRLHAADPFPQPPVAGIHFEVDSLGLFTKYGSNSSARPWLKNYIDNYFALFAARKPSFHKILYNPYFIKSAREIYLFLQPHVKSYFKISCIKSAFWPLQQGFLRPHHFWLRFEVFHYFSISLPLSMVSSLKICILQSRKRPVPAPSQQGTPPIFCRAGANLGTVWFVAPNIMRVVCYQYLLAGSFRQYEGVFPIIASVFYARCVISGVAKTRSQVSFLSSTTTTTWAGLSAWTRKHYFVFSSALRASKSLYHRCSVDASRALSFDPGNWSRWYKLIIPHSSRNCRKVFSPLDAVRIQLPTLSSLNNFERGLPAPWRALATAVPDHFRPVCCITTTFPL